MEIVIKDGVVYDTEKEVQSEAAQEWLNSEVLGKVDETEPTRDRFGRPVSWVIDGDGWMATVTDEYIEEDKPVWRRKARTVSVESKE